MELFKKILLEKERIKLLDVVKNKVKKIGPTFPGLQTSNTLHKHKSMEILLKKLKPYHKKYNIINCWANFSKGNFMCFHKHENFDENMVYFLENKCNMGPMFKKENSEIEVTKCPENSLLIFNNDMLHSAPCHLPQDRYSIAFEMMKK